MYPNIVAIKVLNHSAPFQVRPDYILSIQKQCQPTFSRCTAYHEYTYGTWLRITHFLSCINFDFTIPRVITCAIGYVAIPTWLKLL